MFLYKSWRPNLKQSGVVWSLPRLRFVRFSSLGKLSSGLNCSVLSMLSLPNTAKTVGDCLRWEDNLKQSVSCDHSNDYAISVASEAIVKPACPRFSKTCHDCRVLRNRGESFRCVGGLSRGPSESSCWGVACPAIWSECLNSASRKLY